MKVKFLPPNALDRIEQILELNAPAIPANTQAISATQQLATVNTQAITNVQLAIANLTQNVNQLTDDATRILARDAFLNEMLLEMRSDSKTEEIMEKLDQIIEKLNNA